MFKYDPNKDYSTVIGIFLIIGASFLAILTWFGAFLMAMTGCAFICRTELKSEKSWSQTTTPWWRAYDDICPHCGKGKKDEKTS